MACLAPYLPMTGYLTPATIAQQSVSAHDVGYGGATYHSGPFGTIGHDAVALTQAITVMLAFKSDSDL